MKSVINLLLIFTTFINNLYSQKTNEPFHLYLIPGMGTDYRVFSEYKFDTTLVNPIPIKWEDTDSATNLSAYAAILSKQIDTTSSFVIVGVSMGGMLAMEISQLVHPKGIVLISSAKSHKELPNKYKFGKYLPAHQLFTEKLLQKIASKKRTFKDVKAIQHKELYKNMLLDTGADFLKWQMDAIINWEFSYATKNPCPIFHIHGDKDNILPIKNIRADKIIQGGTHKMVVNKSADLSRLIEQFIHDGVVERQ